MCRWSSISQGTQSPARYRCHHVTGGMCISQWHSCSCCIWSTWWSAGTAQHARSWIPRCMSQVSWKQWGLCVRLNPLCGGKHSATTMFAASDRSCVHSVEATHTQPHRCTMNVWIHMLQAPVSCLLTVVCETSHGTCHWRVDPSLKYASARVSVGTVTCLQGKYWHWF